MILSRHRHPQRPHSGRERYMVTVRQPPRGLASPPPGRVAETQTRIGPFRSPSRAERRAETIRRISDIPDAARLDVSVEALHRQSIFAYAIDLLVAATPSKLLPPSLGALRALARALAARRSRRAPRPAGLAFEYERATARGGGVRAGATFTDSEIAFVRRVERQDDLHGRVADTMPKLLWGLVANVVSRHPEIADEAPGVDVDLLIAKLRDLGDAERPALVDRLKRAR